MLSSFRTARVFVVSAVKTYGEGLKLGLREQWDVLRGRKPYLRRRVLIDAAKSVPVIAVFIIPVIGNFVVLSTELIPSILPTPWQSIRQRAFLAIQTERRLLSKEALLSRRQTQLNATAVSETEKEKIFLGDVFFGFSSHVPQSVSLRVGAWIARAIEQEDAFLKNHGLQSLSCRDLESALHDRGIAFLIPNGVPSDFYLQKPRYLKQNGKE